MSDPRATVAYLLWCINEGYLKAEDRIGENWFTADPSTLHPKDVVTQRHLLAMADEVLSETEEAIRADEAAKHHQPRQCCSICGIHATPHRGGGCMLR